MAKSWLEKFNNPEIQICEKNFGVVPEGKKFPISTPMEIDSYIHFIPNGQSVSSQKMKKDIAGKYNVGFMCPSSAGIFTRIVAELAYENYTEHQKTSKITSFWRVIDLKMPLAEKLSFGSDFIKDMRQTEGLPL